MEQASPVAPAGQRIVSIDVLRGLVMIIMALDHVRDFFHSSAIEFDPLDLQKTSVLIFLTRWITNYCAPVFVFLSGTSAFLTLERKGKKGLSKFLFTRGLWLVIVEVTLINFSLNFLQFFSFLLLQTIWALGISMMVLSALIYLPKRLLLVTGLVIITCHNLLDNFHVPGNTLQALGWSILHELKFFTFSGFGLLVGYPVLPWIGVMTAGYCFGELYTRYRPHQRKRILTGIGVFCIIAFIALRYSNLYGDLNRWSHQKNTVFTILSFIKTTKYPPSLLYILMTLGPAILFLAFAEKPLNSINRVVAVFGRVPMFYYIMHLYFIRIAHIILALLSGFDFSKITASSIFQPLQGFGFRLPVVYIIWLTLIVLLYPLCKRYDAYKTANKQKWWLSYL